MNSRTDINLLIKYFESLKRSQHLTLRSSATYNGERVTDNTLDMMSIDLFLTLAKHIVPNISNPRIFKTIKSHLLSASYDGDKMIRSVGGLIEFLDGLEMLSHRISTDVIFEYAIFYYFGSEPTKLSLFRIGQHFIDARDAIQSSRPDEAAKFEDFVERNMKSYIDAEKLLYDCRPEEEVAEYLLSLLNIPGPTIH